MEDGSAYTFALSRYCQVTAVADKKHLQAISLTQWSAVYTFN